MGLRITRAKCNGNKANLDDAYETSSTTVFARGGRESKVLNIYAPSC